MKSLSLVDEAENHDQWIVSYADLISALLAVLLLLASFSKVDIDKFDAVQRSQSSSEAESLQQILKNLEQLAIENDLEGDLEFKLDRNGLEVRFNSVMLFDSGHSELKQGFLSRIDPIFDHLAEVGADRYVDIIGHTDDQAFRKGHQTNWTLSAERAASLHQHLLDKAMPKDGTRLIAYADTMPEIPFKGLKGEELKHARAANRRVSVLIGLLKSQ
ncbi:OmpA/MotB family protein [Vibrio sp. WXL210]|uniref:OmpA/MotB family protein n=1 Tax=Vibrio sp. WXL210 TaxID=3450709 RepID=UPI003EC5A51B